ncbi:MAG TPA: hypothetical protein VK752_11025 [Bryobacteraceae bacterium]|nr:hypothetical protein [Bryobacteraceae bacterium]
MSLLDMLPIYAPGFLRIAEIVTEYLKRTEPAALHGNKLESQAEYDETIRALRDLQAHSSRMFLSVSAASMERTLEEFSKEVPNAGQIRTRLSEWYNCFLSELKSSLFLMVLPHRAPYFAYEQNGQTRGGIEAVVLLRALANFRDARYDATEAGACFAFGCFTACVHHLMRVTEHGLISVAASLNVPADKLSKGWDGCIQGIGSAIKLIESTKPTPDWQDEVKKYNDLSSWFTNIKTGWRNPVSHVPRIYSEQTAKGIFSATCTLFEHLNIYGFKQTVMPSDPLPLPTN